MATVTKICDVCGVEYRGHHNSKRCPQCKQVADDNNPVAIGSDVVVEDIVNEPTPIDGDWRQYGMCENGYEVFPGWVWSQKKLVCVGGDAPREVIEMMQDAFQRRVVNRRPTLGDADYGRKQVVK